MRKHLFILTFAFALLSVSQISAQKFGYVNSQELIQDIPEVKEANSNIETYRNQLQKKGQEMLKSLQAKYQELERKQAQGEISPKQLEEEAARLKQEEQTILSFEQESQQKILKKSEDLLSPLRDKIQNAIDEVAAENNFDYIFDYSTGFVLFADKSTDVSALVKAKLKQ
ncbi:MAG: OmpH family outer membrane protein [Bacteroidia bacterium]|nr:OmpH family outer membrane protein [Bacteroidia bacterium]MBT8229146.1 OmpH family outer membrane protein [Bacteroidia bacterium]